MGSLKLLKKFCFSVNRMRFLFYLVKFCGNRMNLNAEEERKLEFEVQ